MQGWKGMVLCSSKGRVDHGTSTIVLNSQYIAGGVQSPYSYSINVSTVENFCAEMSSLEALVAEIQGWKGKVLCCAAHMGVSIIDRKRTIVLNSQYIAGGVQSPYCSEFTFERSDSYVYSCYR